MKKLDKKYNNPVIGEEDKYIGKRIRQARIEKGYTQTSIAKMFNISSQQVQKFEFGHNRVTAKMLYKLSDLCDKPMEWFTQDINKNNSFGSTVELQRGRFMLNVIRYFEKIKCEKKQAKALKLIKLFFDDTK